MCAVLQDTSNFCSEPCTFSCSKIEIMMFSSRSTNRKLRIDLFKANDAAIFCVQSEILSSHCPFIVRLYKEHRTIDKCCNVLVRRTCRANDSASTPTLNSPNLRMEGLFSIASIKCVTTVFSMVGCAPHSDPESLISSRCGLVRI